MTGRIEKTVFISYRRTNLPWALAIFQNLKNEGYDVFFDYLSIPSGDFESIIVENIKARAHFVVILTPSALERCNEPGDWLRREIETAIDEKRNIIPLMLESFDFGSPSTVNTLTGKLEQLKKYNGLRLHSEYFFEGMDRLRKQYLNISLDTVIHPISEEAKPVIKEHQSAADEATVVKKEELSAQEWYERGFIFFQNNQLDETIRCCNEAISLDPNFPRAYSLRGSAQTFIAHNYDEAIKDYSMAIQFESNNSEKAMYHLFKGDVFFKKGDLDRATIEYNNSIQLKPSDPDAYFYRGQTYKKKNILDKALSDYLRAVELDPKNGSYYSDLGDLLSDEYFKRYEEAETAYRKAIELDPTNDLIYSGFGNLLSSEYFKRYEEAEFAYRKAIELDPASDLNYSGLGDILSDEYFKRYEEAEAAYRKAIELDLANDLNYCILGDLLSNEYFKRYEEAELAYRKAIELDPANDLNYSVLGDLLSGEYFKRYEEAEAAYRKSIELNPTAENYYILGRHLADKQIKKYDEAEKMLLHATNLDPNNSESLYCIACIKSINRDLDSALHFLKLAISNGFDKQWAWNDTDLDWIKEDQRFVEIVDPKPLL